MPNGLKWMIFQIYLPNYQYRDNLYLVISRIVQSSSWRFRLLFRLLNNILSASYFFRSIFFYHRLPWRSFFSSIIWSSIRFWLPRYRFWGLSCILRLRRLSCIFRFRRLSYIFGCRRFFCILGGSRAGRGHHEHKNWASLSVRSRGSLEPFLFGFV